MNTSVASASSGASAATAGWGSSPGFGQGIASPAAQAGGRPRGHNWLRVPRADPGGGHLNESGMDIAEANVRLRSTLVMVNLLAWANVVRVLAQALSA